MPLKHWWQGELKNTLLPILLEPKTLQRGYFKARAVRNLMEEHLSGRRVHSNAIWVLLVFELWQRNFLESGAYRGCCLDGGEASATAREQVEITG